MIWLVRATVLTACFLAFATSGFMLGASRLKHLEDEMIVLDVRVAAIEAAADRAAYESAAKHKIGELMIEMDAKAAGQCKHNGPRFIAEDSQGTFCIDCGAKIGN